MFNLFQNVEPISSEQKEEYCSQYNAKDPFEHSVTPRWFGIMDFTAAVVVAIAGSSMFWNKNLRTHP